MMIIASIISLLVFNGWATLSALQNLFNNQRVMQSNQIIFTPDEYLSTPRLKPNAKQLQVAASSALIYDVDSAQKLFEKNPDTIRPIASLTKLMTALIILENHSLDEEVKIPELPTLDSLDQKLGVKTNEKFRLDQLIKALLIYSANDVADALAIWDSGSIQNFSLKMNQKAQQWGLRNSYFENPSGLDTPKQHSTAHDLVILTNILLHNKPFKQIIATKYTIIKDVNGEIFNITSTNKLLGSAGVVGVKTGFTLQAGQCLITLSQHDEHQIITVILDSPDRFTESKNMIDWAFTNYIWQ